MTKYNRPPDQLGGAYLGGASFITSGCFFNIIISKPQLQSLRYKLTNEHNFLNAFYTFVVIYLFIDG